MELKKRTLSFLRKLYDFNILVTEKKPQKKINFLIIGAAKSATTSLHFYLSKHPNIYLSKELKEPSIFLNNSAENIPFWKDLKKRGMKASRSLYKTHFSKDITLRKLSKTYSGETYFGESTTFYSMSPFLPEAPLNIYSYNKDMKIIYILRNPYDRIISQYYHDLKKSKKKYSFEFYLKNNNSYLLNSLYYYQLSNYLLQGFKKKQILILFCEELSSKPQETLKKVYDFLEIDRQILEEKKLKKYNKTREKDLSYPSEILTVIHPIITKDIENLESFTKKNLRKIWKLDKKEWNSRD
jgi:hypothetical protein